MSEKIKGIVTFVAKTNGIKIDDGEIWYNPKGNAEKYINKELVGKEVEITLKDNSTDFDFIAVSGRTGVINVDNSREAQKYTSNKSGSESVKIYKQVALKCAVKLAANNQITLEEIFKKAKEFTDWIMEE